MAVIMRCLDWRGRSVTLDERTWHGKILLDHGELDGHEAAIADTVSDPDIRCADRTYQDRIVFYRRGVLSGANRFDCLKVVVAYQMGDDRKREGRVVTAFMTDGVARGEIQLWIRPKRRE